ncbi:MAG: hypothetical protein AB7H71_00840 [Alphaproteobacteria bacterium]
MSSLDLEAETKPQAKAGVLYGLLDPAFGFFVWAIHFLVVYIAEAVACALGLGGAGAETRTIFLTALILVTTGAAAVLALHGVLRYRRLRALPQQRFRMSVAIGGDAIAAVAVLWQLFPLGMISLCV